MALSFFIFGVSGYIGGAVLLGIRKTYGPETHFAALVRSESQLPLFEELGIKIVQGANQDHQLIADHLAKNSYDAVIQCADCDDLPYMNAILAGMKKRYEATGKAGVLLHTSGTGTITDQPLGKWLPSAEKVWDDSKPEDIGGIAETQPHRYIDLAVFAASNAGYIRSYIIAPSCIYGTAYNNPIHKVSQLVPTLIRVDVKNGKAVRIGEGTNRWNNVHIKDLIELYLLVLKSALDPASSYTSPLENFYFGSVEEHEWGAIASQIARILFKKGVLRTAEVQEVTFEQYPELENNGNNSRSVANRGKKLGWVPQERSIKDTLEEDIDAVLKGW